MKLELGARDKPSAVVTVHFKIIPNPEPDGRGGVVWGGCRMFCALGLVFGVGVCVWVCFCVRILKKIGGVTCIANVRGVVLAADWGC